MPAVFRRACSFRLAWCLVLGLALFLRLFGIADESLWLDEGDALRAAQLPLPEMAADRYAVGHPPLYFALLAAWLHLTGTSDANARLLSALCSVAAVGATWRLGRLLGGRTAALLASLFMAVSPLQIHYAQEVRGYALVTLLMLWATRACIHLLRRPGNRLALAAYLATTIAIVHVHVLGVLLLLPHVAELGWRWVREPACRRTAWRPWLTAALVMGVACLPVLAGLRTIAGTVAGGSSAWMLPVPDWSSLGALAGMLAGPRWMLPVMLLAAVAALRRPASGRRAAAERLLLWWAVLPLLAGLGLSATVLSLFLPRYFIALIPAWCLLTALWLRRGFPPVLRTLLVLAVLLAHLPVLHHYYTTQEKEEWRYLAWFIDQNAQADDLLLFNAGYCRDAVYRHYTQRTDLPLRPFPVRHPVSGRLLSAEEQGANSAAATVYRAITDTNIVDVAAVIGRHPRVWLIAAHQVDARGRLRHELSRHRFLQYEEHLAGIDLYVYGDRPQRLRVIPR